ncbi:hypothetical protein [Synechococcus elongatus]|uniref:Uncharacterized protein n=1 Tax=Synechococcus elongatus PCC 11802 TaxID=2283154 RepID=A0AAT9K588_SYNEL|nr:hypothetical protein [Synechococcus elongatus]QFZ92244.1 hypothetical protein EKO22_07615 [Synechococcus elongatus PCC 11802]
MTYVFLPTLALLPSQDWAFQLGLSLVIFVVLNSLVWLPRDPATHSQLTKPAIADPEEDYLPKELQKQGPTPVEMESFCHWDMKELPFSEWQSLLSASKQRWSA